MYCSLPTGPKLIKQPTEPRVIRIQTDLHGGDFMKPDRSVTTEP